MLRLGLSVTTLAGNCLSAAILLGLGTSPASAEAGTPLRVWVRDSLTGHGLASVVHISAGSTSSRSAMIRRSAESGYATLDLPDGHVELRVSAPGYAALGTRLDVAPSATTPLLIWLDPLERDPEHLAPAVDAPLDPALCRLHGHVIDTATGRPLPGVSVSLSSAGFGGMTDADGYFQFEVPGRTPADPFTPVSLEDLIAEAPGLKTAVISGMPLLPGGAKHFIIDMEPGVGMTRWEDTHHLLGATGYDPAEEGGRSADASGSHEDHAERAVAPEQPDTLPLPLTIRVGHNCSGRTCTWAESMSLETYVERGLDNEWIASWKPDSLRAGAIAYRSYGAYFVAHPINPSLYDICDTTSCQVYSSALDSRTQSAAIFTKNMILSQDGTSAFYAEYSAENNGLTGTSCVNDSLCSNGFAGSPAYSWPCLSDSPCTGWACSGHGRGMCQWGTSRWADQGKAWPWITDHYYNNNLQASQLRSAYLEELPRMSVSTNLDGRLEVFARGGNDNALWHDVQSSPGGDFSGWHSLSGVVRSYPGCGQNSDGRIQAFARGITNVFWTKSQTTPNGNTWSAWSQIGTLQVSSEPAIARRNNLLYIFVRGKDYALYVASQTSPGGGFSSWTNLGGILTTQPAVAANQDGRLQVFARGTNDALWTIWQTPEGPWSAWTSLAGVMASAPAVGVNQDGRLEVFARDGSNVLQHVWQTQPNGGWSAWASLAGSVNSIVSVGSNLDGRMQVFARGESGNDLKTIYQTVVNGGWSNWSSLGGVLTSEPVAARNTDGRLVVFVRGTDRRIYSMTQTSPSSPLSWGAWTSLGGTF